MDSPSDVAAAADAQVPPPGPRRLRRRPDDGHIAGVCAGVAEYFNVDPVIVRIAAVVLLFSGPGAFAYVLAWIFVPAVPGPVEYGAAQAPIDRKDRATQVFGIVLIVLAVSVFWGDWWSPARHWLLPLGLMGLGAWLLLRRADEEDDAAPTSAASPSTPAPPPAAWAWGAGDVTVPAPVDPAATTDAADTPTDPTVVVDPTTVEPTMVDATIPLAAGEEGDAPSTGDAGDGGDPPAGLGDTSAFAVPPPATPVPRTRSRRRVLGPIVFGALLVWAGIAVLAGVTVETGLAGSLLILGMGFVLGAFVGGSRLLILPALLVGAAMIVAAVIDIPLGGPVGQQLWAPTIPAQLYRDMEVSLGEGTLDLRGVDIPAGEETAADVSVGVGHLLVIVPPGMAVEVRTEVGAGESDVFGERQSGVNVTTNRSVGGDTTTGTVVLDLQVGVGQIEVRRDALDYSSPIEDGPTTTVAPDPTIASDPTIAPDPTLG